MSQAIQDMTACQLARQIADGKMSSTEAVEAHVRQIESVNPSLNAVVVPLFEQAMSEARAADQRQASGEALGPLHGVPITIKEMFDVQGTPTTAGLTTRAKHRAGHDAVTVARLRAAGAIVLGKTNVPQLGMMAESDNPVYGRTNHPTDPDRGPGGSSGGEAAIVAAKGSPLGLGSDGGGSIRFPSHACGICGFKPTGKRLSMLGHWTSSNWPSDWAQPGPMARDVDDLILALQVLSAKQTSQFDECPLPLGDPAVIPVDQLRIGVYEQLDALPAAPAIRRAVVSAAASLEASGAEMIAFELPEVEAIWDLYMQIFYAEGLRDIRRQLKGSVIDWRTRDYVRLSQLPTLARPVFARTASWIGQKRIGGTLSTLKRPVVSADRYCDLMMQMAQYRMRFQRLLDRHQLDALIGPPCAITAFPHGEFYANYALVYTGVYNLLGLPAGVVPVTQVQAHEASISCQGSDAVDRCLAGAASGSEGLPVGVQVIGRWWQDEVVLAVMKEVFTASE